MTRHLGEQLSAYVDRRLDPAVLVAFDRHVTVCIGCRYAVDQERILLASLRTAAEPGPPVGLHQLLLELDECAAPARRPARVATLAPSAPAQHVSPRRATMFAGLAAGTCAVAAWCLASVVAPVGAAPSFPPTQQRATLLPVVQAGFTPSNVGAVHRGSAQPARLVEILERVGR